MILSTMTVSEAMMQRGLATLKMISWIALSLCMYNAMFHLYLENTLLPAFIF